MLTTSALYKSILEQMIHTFEVKVSIGGTEYGMDALTYMQASNAAFGSGNPEIGTAASGMLTVSLYATSDAVPRMAEVIPYFRVVDGTRQSEWIQKGCYYVDTRSYDNASGILTLQCYDAMLKGEQDYPSTSHSWPYSDINVVRECATVLGVSVDDQTVSLMNAGYTINLPSAYTVRETLQYLAALYGGSFVISDSNTLRLLCIWNRKTTADFTATGNCSSLTISPDFQACTGIRFLADDDVAYFAGSTSGYVYEIECPFANQARATTLNNKMSNFVYRPYSAEGAKIDPAVEIGDTVSVDGNLSNVFSYDINFGALCPADIAAPNSEELDHEFPYYPQADRKFTRKLKEMRSEYDSELSIQAQAIAAKVSRTGGDASSFGWYLDADKFQLLADNAVVMLVNRDGLSVQGVVNATAGNIGGCSIANGVLKIANANIESLNAGKITAGTLSVDRIASKSLEGSKIADYTLSSTKIDDGAAVNRVIGASAVSYAKTSFQSTLDQVGTNKANIDAINGYFTGSANFNALSALSFALNYHYLALEQITIGGVNRKVVTWT